MFFFKYYCVKMYLEYYKAKGPKSLIVCISAFLSQRVKRSTNKPILFQKYFGHISINKITQVKSCNAILWLSQHSPLENLAFGAMLNIDRNIYEWKPVVNIFNAFVTKCILDIKSSKLNTLQISTV